MKPVTKILLICLEIVCSILYAVFTVAFFEILLQGNVVYSLYALFSTFTFVLYSLTGILLMQQEGRAWNIVVLCHYAIVLFVDCILCLRGLQFSEASISSVLLAMMLQPIICLTAEVICMIKEKRIRSNLRFVRKQTFSVVFCFVSFGMTLLAMGIMMLASLPDIWKSVLAFLLCCVSLMNLLFLFHHNRRVSRG